MDITLNHITIIISAFGVFVALIALIWQTRQTNEQMKLNFFADYTKRYQEILLNLPYEINSPDFDFTSLKAGKRERTLRYIQAYFDLCSEEYYLNKAGKIDKKVWLEWEEGIRYTFSKQAYKKAWDIIKLDSQFYGDFHKWLLENEMIDG